MKTAISIPDDVFQQAEQVAKRLKMSRSELYVNAVKAFLAAHSSGEVITRKLDEIYAAASPGLDAVTAEIQRRSIGSESW
jgi:metal-responsive CopG/Arc/MetJ family transcriptional regulator